MKIKLFISAYACEPGLGSEIGVGWHWVLEMSQRFELWVLTRASNRHTIEPWIARHPEYAGIHFLYFDLPKWARFWKKGLRGVRTYYNIWQRLTNRIVKRTMQANGITAFHHLTYGNALWPVSDYGSKQTFIWGPIGGLETIPEDYTSHYDSKSRLLEKIRRSIVKRAVKSRSFKSRCRRADLILCKTEETMSLLPSDTCRNAILFTDVAADIMPFADTIIPHTGLDLIVVGRLDAWRGFDIAIIALSKVIKTIHDVHLTIVGKGADDERLKKLVAELDLQENVTFTGAVSQEEYRRLMMKADIVLNPSLKEGAVTVSFDAMSMGKPLIAVDTGGYTRYFGPEYSIVVPRLGRDETIGAIAAAIQRLSDTSLRTRMGGAAKKSASNFSWNNHGEEIRKIIERTIADN
ncbi:glycosyltransferase family 4 protein [Bacteroides caecimuris]|uniref:glycosyltransferase family 4 protein n=1 Tax=Bacteroides caecimuris TaxID=1796613 RepID=UPI0026E5526A|nr:glycosyltransferase [Bacteroides caecimuris]